MKKLFVTILTTATISLSSFAAGTEEVSQQVMKTFKKDFTNASNVEWVQSSGLNKATFSLNGKVLFAFYTNAGELVATSRNLTSDQLPMSLNTELRSSYEQFWISDLFELSSNQQTTYYVTVENADQKIILQSNGLSGWQTYRKEKKCS